MSSLANILPFRRTPRLSAQPQRIAALTALLLLTTGIRPLHGDENTERFFETKIRPLLAEHCLECHGEQEQSADLRLDSREALLRGGESGPVIDPDSLNSSRLLLAVRRSEDLAMPPDDELTAQQIRALEHWVGLGAPWPADSGPILDPRSRAAQEHWAFQPVREVTPPTTDAAWYRNPVDAFVLRRLQEQNLSPSGDADRATLIRRASIALTGLPPTVDDTAAFVQDDRTDALEELVERLLSSPAYGEQWARHWLDIARYSDTKGYVYAREDRRWVHAWNYRDWVIDALNTDMSYDRFLLLQLAADQVTDRRPQDLAAMGFLTVGRRFLGVTRDIIDDRIDVITRGTMGLTVACARCHDHKYDPVPTDDYYSLYGVLNSSEEKRTALPSPDAPPADWAAELKKRQTAFDTRYATERQTASDRCRDKLADYLAVQNHLDTIPAQGFDQVLLPDDVLPAFARRWEEYLRVTRRTDDPVFRHWHAYADLAPESFPQQAGHITEELQSLPATSVNARITIAFQQPPKSFDDVIARYATVLEAVRDDWRTQLKQAETSSADPPSGFASAVDEQLRQVLYGDQSPCEVPNESIVHTEYLFTTKVCVDLWKLQAQIDAWLQSAPHQPRYALTLTDRAQPSEPRVFRRGNPKTPGNDVPRSFLSVLTTDDATPFQQGSGRLELAQSIATADNPLTARVMVNRVWAWHFGRGLVATPSDFGVRAGEPSHPDLLDWLTQDFIDHHWSLKHLHRRILLSSTWRQSSAEPADPDLLERIRERDPSNRLLWRMPLHRLSFEEFRDSILAITDELDLQSGGRPEPLFGTSPSVRRSIYGEFDRQFFPTALRVFDVANPDIHIPQRSETTVPQQALFYMNHPLVQGRARQLAAATADAASDEQRLQQMFERVLLRPANPEEVQDSLELIAQAVPAPPTAAPQTEDWSYLYGRLDEEQGRVVDTATIPHFTGSAWQGGVNWPDGQLGWVQLTATGGHPGNDRQHACVRRWTAPRDMTLAITSKLIHEPRAGDGIRAFIVSSQSGQLCGQHVHQQTVTLNQDSLTVGAGETVDFVVDIGDGLNSDQFLWEITIQETGAESSAGTWNSKRDFIGVTPTPLTPWEQLAQILLCSNEFLFVD